MQVERGRASAEEVVARVKRRDAGGREEDALPILVQPKPDTINPEP